MSSFSKFGERIELLDGSWITVNRFEPLDENRANIEFVYIGRNKKRNAKRVAKKVSDVPKNLWKFQYDGHIIYFEMV